MTPLHHIHKHLKLVGINSLQKSVSCIDHCTICSARAQIDKMLMVFMYWTTTLQLVVVVVV